MLQLETVHHTQEVQWETLILSITYCVLLLFGRLCILHIIKIEIVPGFRLAL